MSTPTSGPTSGPARTPLVPAALMELIVCPACHGDLTLTETAGGPAGTGELSCGGCGLVYPVRDAIPVLLVDEARKPV